MSIILGMVFNDYLLFPLVIIIVIIMAVISLKGDDYLLNLLLVLGYIGLTLFASYVFDVMLYVNTVFVLIFAIIGIVVIAFFGAKVIIMDGIKGGWKTLKADSFKDK